MIFLDPAVSFAIYGVAGSLVLMTIQGVLVWMLAKLIAKLAGRLHWAAKLAFVALSWLVWVIGGTTVWTLLGGGGGLFEGGIWLFAVIPTGIYGSVIAAFLWLMFEPRGTKADA